MQVGKYSYNIHVQNVHPREVLEGRLEIIPAKTIRLVHAYIEYMGEAKCSWALDKSEIRFPRYYPKGTEMSGLRTFYYARHNIYNSDEFVLIASRKVFSFSTKIPHGPPTWSGQFGSISYRLKITIKLSNLETYTHEEDINVLPNLDLTLEPHLFNEIRHKTKRHYKFGMQKLGSVLVTLWFPLCGYSCGQSIPVLIKVDNLSEIKFGGLILVLTMIEVYRSQTPFVETKTFRKDVCRVVRMVDITYGSNEYYALLELEQNLPVTNQFSRCICCQVIYKVWLTLQAAIPRYSGYGYPHLTTPGISIVVGNVPLYNFAGKQVTALVMDRLLSFRTPVFMEPSLTKEVEELRDFVDNELSQNTIMNLTKQVDEYHTEHSQDNKKNALLNISSQISSTRSSIGSVYSNISP